MKKILLVFVCLIFSGQTLYSQGFTPGNIVVSRYGDGLGDLPTNSTAVPVFLDEYDLSGNLVQSVAVPVVRTEETRNRVLTGGMTSNYEGLITLSPNGYYLTVIGHNVLPGEQYSDNTQRTIGVVTSDGYINITTAVRANVGEPRCAITNNGVNFWFVGSKNGLKYKSINTIATNDVVINRPPNANNSVYIYNDQLYYTSNYDASAEGAKIGIVGEGLPNDGQQVIKHLPGFPTNAAPGQMVMLDSDRETPEPDLLYVTDLDKGDLQKWVF